MVATGTILVTDTGTGTILVTDTGTGTILVTGTATRIQITDMGTGTTRAGGIATGGGLGDATDISLRPALRCPAALAGVGVWNSLARNRVLDRQAPPS